MRKLAILGAGSVLLALGAAALLQRPGGAQQGKPAPDSVTATAIAAGDTSDLSGPRQPIFFRHDIHAGQYKIQCQYCHYSVGRVERARHTQPADLHGVPSRHRGE